VLGVLDVGQRERRALCDGVLAALIWCRCLQVPFFVTLFLPAFLCGHTCVCSCAWQSMDEQKRAVEKQKQALSDVNRDLVRV